MTIFRLLTLSTFVLSFMFASAGIADAGVLDPIIALAQDIMGDLSTLVTVIGAIAFIVSVIMMMFGQGNAWKIALIAFLIVVGVNAPGIVSSIAGA